MSLLNDMLHDLAKKKPLEQTRPSLAASYSQPKQKNLKRYLPGVIACTCLLIVGIAVKHHSFVSANTTPDSADEEMMKTETQEKQSLPARKVSVQPMSKEAYKAQIKKALEGTNPSYLNEDKTAVQKIIGKEPSNTKAREQLATIYLTEKNFKKAIAVVNDGLEYAPDNPELFTIKAKVFIAQEQFKQAIDLLKSDHPSIVDHPEFYATLGSALALSGNIAEAGTYFKSLIKVDPNNGRYWLGYGLSLEQAKQYADAKMAYKRASKNKVSGVAVRKIATLRLNTMQG